MKIRLLGANKTVGYTFKKGTLKNFFSQYYPLIAILIGFMLVSFSAGPYHNGDTAWEYDAVSGVTKYGMPYANQSYLIDQPPLGFYLQAGFLSTVGNTINNGVFLVTLFGLGSVTLVYLIGKALYGHVTGVFAAALIAFSPWHVIFSRAFLIDGVCLFFSLLSLFIGLKALHKGAIKLFLLSGIFFAVAFNTKLYAVFVLIPLAAFFFYSHPRTLMLALKWLAVFALPPVFSATLWYQVIAGIGLQSIFLHADFVVHEPTNISPTYFFVFNFLVNYGLGWLFIDTAVLALLVCLLFRRNFSKFLVFDVICLATIASVIGVNTFLGTTLDLKAPYLNAIKYDYQALPFFSLLAASLVTKGLSLIDLSKTKKLMGKVSVFALALIGFLLLAATVLYNMNYTHMISSWNYLLFRVEPNVNFGYSLFNSTPLAPNSALMALQYSGFAVAFSGLIWMSRRKIKLLTNFLAKNSRLRR